MIRRALTALVALSLLVPAAAASADTALKVSWSPARPRVGDVALLSVHGAGLDAVVEGTVGGRPLVFFRDGGGHAALTGFDLELPEGTEAWQLEVREPGRATRRSSGTVQVLTREFPVQRLTLPTPMVDLDPEAERRATVERDTLRALYRTVTPERLWSGAFARPLAGSEPGSGFGSRRILNGQPRAPHAGTDYGAARGTPVLAVNDGRVAHVGDYIIQGKLVVIYHGLGLQTVYFHLDEMLVEAGDRLWRGQPLGTVGSTGRATGPHLHFGVQVGPARVDPDTLLALPLR